MEQPNQKQQGRRVSPDAKSFTDILLELERGRLLPEIEEALQDLTHAVMQTGKGGTLTVKLSVKPASGGDTNQLLIKGKVTPNKPYPDKPTTLYFADDDHRLMRKDPRQYEMNLGPVVPQPMQQPPEDDQQ